ncbi:DJ-1/PfpI family protein [Actinoplanes oblitus]|uniref:DJ-1/PfpI family protein n=1 Tax=Actinoplanes oblitus TaxID=3040509 RepID=A0ABY8W798_9ACTN|nr:DJ-1/PfpI family protein [Actinoplanes oblitus]WIM92825.1 DJ-1/PfpI family protein [Actinoplanes oblitus]
MRLQGCRIGVLIESDYYEPEIFYYRHRFAEEGAELHFLSRLWGQPEMTFTGHEFGAPFVCGESFEPIGDAELAGYSAIIVPSGMVADRLRYTDSPDRLPPATEFLARAFAHHDVVKGLICHGMWLVAPRPELVRGRRAVAHNNLLGDLRNMGVDYVDSDVVVDDDLVTARTGEHCHAFAAALISAIARRRGALPRGMRDVPAVPDDTGDLPRGSRSRNHAVGAS